MPRNERAGILEPGLALEEGLDQVAHLPDHGEDRGDEEQLAERRRDAEPRKDDEAEHHGHGERADHPGRRP